MGAYYRDVVVVVELGAYIHGVLGCQFYYIIEVSISRQIINANILSRLYTSTPAYCPDPPSTFPRVWFPRLHTSHLSRESYH